MTKERIIEDLWSSIYANTSLEKDIIQLLRERTEKNHEDRLEWEEVDSKDNPEYEEYMKCILERQDAEKRFITGLTEILDNDDTMPKIVKLCIDTIVEQTYQAIYEDVRIELEALTLVLQKMLGKDKEKP